MGIEGEERRRERMEELRKLEKVQTTILFLQSRGLVDSYKLNDPDSNRFLANLILVLIQPCGKLDMDAKSQLISVSLSKITAAFLEDALFLLGEDGDEQIENAVPSHSDEKKAVSCSVQNDSEEIAMVRLDAMLRANSSLEDFCRSYFMFHEMDANKPQSIFRYLPFLSFTESYIYQLDNLNEKLLQVPTSRNRALDRQTDSEENWSWFPKFTELFRTDPFRPLVILLERRGLLTQRIKEEFKCGEQYWTAERKLCYALINKLEISIEVVMKAIHLKSFDYRVLNLLLYQLRGEKVNEMHMEFLSISEFLVEVSDDFII